MNDGLHIGAYKIWDASFLRGGDTVRSLVLSSTVVLPSADSVNPRRPKALIETISTANGVCDSGLWLEVREHDRTELRERRESRACI